MAKKKSRPIPTNTATVKSITAQNAEQENMLKTIKENIITLVKGLPGSGKCINPQTSVLFTENGLQVFKDLIPKSLQVDGYCKTNIRLINKHANCEQSEAIYRSGKRSTRKITTSRGYEIEGTRNHRILCLTNNGVEWQSLESLNEGDYVCIQRKYPELFPSSELENDIAYFVGIMIGDGSYTLNNTFSFSNIDEEILGVFFSFCKKYLSTKPVQSKSRPCDWYVCNKKDRQKLREWGLEQVKGDKKNIPERFLKTGAIKNLLRGLFDTDGWVEKTGQVCFLNKSEMLCRQIHLSLLRLGIISSLRKIKKKYDGEFREYWIISVLLSHLQDFQSQVGFNVAHKKKRLSFLLSKTRNTNLDTIPSIYIKKVLGDYYRGFVYKDRSHRNEFSKYIHSSAQNPSYAKLSSIYSKWGDKYPSKAILELLSNKYFFDPIKNISDLRSDVSDFVMPETNSFVANGFINHNTFLAVGYALQSLFNKECKQIIFTRPVVEAGGEKLGFLPGTMYEKINPYMLPVFHSLSKFLPQELADKVIYKSGNGNGNGNGNGSNGDLPIKVLPLAFMRGAAQPLYSPVATPNGWRKMGEIKSGDMVVGSNGEPVRVIQIFPHKNKKIYRVGFSDGSSVDCCNEHLWSTRTLSEKRHDKPFSTKNTEQIAKSLKTRFGQKNHEIPLLSSPLRFEERDVPVDPYALGLLLGDGCLHETASITFATADTELIDNLTNRLPDIEIKYAGQYDYRLVKNPKNRYSWLKTAVRNLGLLGTKSKSKFVPDIYKYNSPEVRIEMIRGLLDSDGYITTHRSGRRRINYYTISDSLAYDMVEMIQSLGGIAYMQKKKYYFNSSRKINGQHKWFTTNEIKNIWCVDIVFDGCNLFRLSRKADVFSKTDSPRVKRLIASVEYIGNMDCQCIQIDSPDHLYVTNSSVLTHNTFDHTFVVGDEMQNASPEQIRMLLTRIGKRSKMILCGDIYQSDIRARNGLVDAFELLDGIKGIGFVTLGKNAIVRHPIIKDIEERYLSQQLNKQDN